MSFIPQMVAKNVTLNTDFIGNKGKVHYDFSEILKKISLILGENIWSKITENGWKCHFHNTEAWRIKLAQIGVSKIF